MNNRIRVILTLVAAIFLLSPLAALAQETTSAIRVTVYDPNGEPVPGATVTLTDTRTATVRSLTTSDGGTASASGLRVGGPFTVQVASDKFQNQTVTDIMLRLGDVYVLPVQLGADAAMEEIVVTSASLPTSQLALGPASTYGLKDLEEYPAINRDIRDIIRFDPRIYQDAAFVGAIQCAGANPRFNSLTVDGVRMNDNFGLNSNGYPTERQPFPYDAIQEVSVEVAPFDVQYGGFSACNINAVTKSGENEFHGSLFFDYSNDSMKGDEIEGDPVDNGEYTKERYGFSLGGPILKDTLFFFVAYEYLEEANLFDRGPTGSTSFGRIIPGVNQAQLDEIAAIAQSVYGYDPGGFPSSLPVEDEKYTIKLDWDINDSHRASLTYNWNDGYNIAQADNNNSSIEYAGHFYERGAELTAYTGALFSDWTDRFSTEVRASYSELDNRQIALNGTDFGEVQIRTFNDADGDGAFSSATVYLGADDSRHANDLYYDTWSYKLAGTYLLDEHKITFGYELDDLSIFNMFIQETEGEYLFLTGCNAANPNGCIERFRNGIAERITYENAAPSNIPSDAAAQFDYEINTLYLQDEWIVGDGAVTIVGGVRYEWYESNDLPRENANFIARNGYTNAKNFDGLDLWQPRLGFNWEATPTLNVYGGIGLYSGGNPNVWLANNFQSDGQTQVEFQDRTSQPLFQKVWTGSGRPIWDIPQNLYDQVANGTANSAVNAIDPNFELPSNWKYSLGFSWVFGDDYQLNGDILYSDAQDSATIVGATMTQTGTAPDGRPIYTDSRPFATDYILSNVQGADAESLQLSVSLNKSYDFGLDWSVGYAYTDSKDVNPMTSSVAFSNYANIAVSDPNAPDLATSNYEIPHLFTGRLSYTAYWWDDNGTTISLFASANEGQPYSYTFAVDDGDLFGDFADNRHLLYVPTGPTDSKVIFGPTFNTAAFFEFIQESGLEKYSGQIAPRNSFNSDWWIHFDLRLEQEFPGFRKDHKFAGFLIINNFCNLLNDEWCVLREVGFPRTEAVVDMGYDVATNKYIYQAFLQPAGQGRAVAPSLWELKIGLSYRF